MLPEVFDRFVPLPPHLIFERVDRQPYNDDCLVLEIAEYIKNKTKPECFGLAYGLLVKPLILFLVKMGVGWSGV